MCIWKVIEIGVYDMYSQKDIAVVILNYNTWEDSIEEAVSVNSIGELEN